VFVGGYAGELITNRTVVLAFAPDRVAARPPSVAYTIDASQSVAIETTIRQTLRGTSVKAEYSQAYGQHVRATVAGALIWKETGRFYRTVSAKLACVRRPAV
jgi:hypothetical protein